MANHRYCHRSYAVAVSFYFLLKQRYEVVFSRNSFPDPVEFNCSCPHCLQLLIATDEHIGAEMVCPNCSRLIVVTSPAEKTDLKVTDNEPIIPCSNQLNLHEEKNTANEFEINDKEDAAERSATLGAIYGIVHIANSTIVSIFLCVIVFRFFLGHHHHPATTWEPDIFFSLVVCTESLFVFYPLSFFTKFRDLSGLALVAVGSLMLGLCTAWACLICLQLWGIWSVVLACLGLIVVAIPFGIGAAFYSSSHDVAAYLAAFSALAIIFIISGEKIIKATPNNKQNLYQRNSEKPPMGLILTAWVLFVISYYPYAGYLSVIGLPCIVFCLWFSKSITAKRHAGFLALSCFLFTLYGLLVGALFPQYFQ